MQLLIRLDSSEPLIFFKQVESVLATHQPFCLVLLGKVGVFKLWA